MPKRKFPKVGEVFELTLDGNAPDNQPLEMVRTAYGSSEGWRHQGRVVEGTLTKRFKLVQVGYCLDLDEVARRTSTHGANPEGQWIKAFHAMHGSDGQGPIGIADGSWVGPLGGAEFPFIYTAGSQCFDWAIHGRDERWRWLVEVK